MNPLAEFAAALSRALGPLYRVSLLDGDRETVATHGSSSASGARSEIPFPGSQHRLVIEVDVQAIGDADRVLHSLAKPDDLAETPLGAFANLEDALEQLIAQGEGLVGTSLAEMSRTEKQQLVRFLDERGAFQLRKAVERVAEILGVSRFTVYNYLDAIRS